MIAHLLSAAFIIIAAFAAAAIYTTTKEAIPAIRQLLDDLRGD